MSTTTQLLTAELIEKRLSEVLAPKFDTKEFRLSESGACRRKRVARAMGLESEAFTREDAEYFERGNMVEKWVIELFRQSYPRRVRTQEKVKTPYGTGHIDLWFPAEALSVEVKSASVGAEPYLPKSEHLYQVQAYQHFYKDSKGRRKIERSELLYVILGGRLKTISYNVEYNREIGERIEAELIELASMRDKGELPPIPQGYQNDQYPCSWRTRMGEEGKCAFFKHCWGGEQKEEIKGIQTVDELAKVFHEYAVARDAYSELNKAVEAKKQEVRYLEELMADYFASRKAEQLAAGPYVVKRTLVAGRVDYDIESAVLAGVVTKSALEPFKKIGKGYFKWTIKNIEGARASQVPQG